jgi:hypothetical protein
MVRRFPLCLVNLSTRFRQKISDIVPGYEILTRGEGLRGGKGRGVVCCVSVPGMDLECRSGFHGNARFDVSARMPSMAWHGMAWWIWEGHRLFVS